MTDTVNKITRSKIMSKIRAKNTKPEMVVRKALFARGYRYRLHNKNLPGSPDLVLTKYRALIFVNGCFWHLHHCRLNRLPKSNKEFWEKKLIRNEQRDKEIIEKLTSLGWRVGLVWECSIRGKSKVDSEIF